MRGKVIFLMELLPQSVNYIYGFKDVCYFLCNALPLSHVLLNQIPIRCFWNAIVWTGARRWESQTNTMVTSSWNQPENLDETCFTKATVVTIPPRRAPAPHPHTPLHWSGAKSQNCSMYILLLFILLRLNICFNNQLLPLHSNLTMK